MEVIRVLASIFIFCISSYLVYDLFVNGFSWMVLLSIIVGYTLVHYIWPRGKKQNSEWYEFLELIFDLPYRTIAYILRAVGRIIRSSDGGIDIDP